MLSSVVVVGYAVLVGSPSYWFHLLGPAAFAVDVADGPVPSSRSLIGPRTRATTRARGVQWAGQMGPGRVARWRGSFAAGAALRQGGTRAPRAPRPR
jgi:hypothetical protein